MDKHISAIDTLCKQYKVKTLYVFGSVLNEHFNSKSDIDLVVEFDSNLPVEDYADNYFNFKFSLERILKRPVDLLEEHVQSKIHISNSMLTEIDNCFMYDQTKAWLYDILNVVDAIESFFVTIPKGLMSTGEMCVLKKSSKEISKL